MENLPFAITKGNILEFQKFLLAKELVSEKKSNF